MASLASINIRFKADLKGFSSEMQNSLRTMQVVGTKMESIGRSMSTFITLPLLAAGGAAIKFASDYNESVNKVEVAFGPASTAVKDFAKNSLESFGLAEGSALDAAAQFGDMATSMGIPQVAAAKMSTSLVGLAGDLASFKNISIEQANTALAGVFTGETESLKKLGIVMTEANLQSFALSKGIKVQVKDMDQASKVNLRYAFIMANTTNAQGDFARTGGGAANQMRIFQESLKQLAQQFGATILPAFTKVIVFVNGMIKSFSELDPVTKGVIVAIAGVAAATGPLLSVLGNVIGIIPRLVVQFSALQAVILANPYTAAAVGIAALAVGIYAFVQANKEAKTSQEVLNEVVKKGNENAAAEVGILDKLYATATNVNIPIRDRKKAVDDIQSLYPAYFKNVKDEIILNGQATTSYIQLRDAIFNKSRAAAIDTELQNRANERVKDEIKLRENIAATEAEIVRIKRGANEVVLQEASASEKTARVTISKNQLLAAQTKLLAIQNADLKKFNEDALKSDEALFRAKQEYLSKTGKLEENEAAKLADIKIGTDGITAANERLVKSGTIEFYENEIAALTKLQKEQATTNSAWLEYQNNIDAIQLKINALSNKGVKLPKPEVDLSTPETPSTFKLNDLDDQLKYFTELRRQFSDTSVKYKELTEQINNTQLKINAIEGVEEVVEQIETVKDTAASFSESVGQIMASTVESFASGFGQVLAAWANGGSLLKSVGNLFLATLGDLMIQIGKIAIQTGLAITGIKKALQSLNPAVAIGAGVALIALGTLVKSQMQSAGSFTNGGMVGGTSYTGDKLFARVNSGEMILNTKQQNNLSRMINPAVTSGDVAIQLIGGLKISGSDLELVLMRNEKLNKRIK